MEQDEQQEQLGPCEAGRPDVDTLIGGTRSRLPAASPGAKPSPLPPIPHPPAEQALGHSICQASQHGVSASEGRRKRDGQKACAQWGCYQKSVKIKLIIWQQGPAAASPRKRRWTGKEARTARGMRSGIGLGPGCCGGDCRPRGDRPPVTCPVVLRSGTGKAGWRRAQPEGRRAGRAAPDPRCRTHLAGLAARQVPGDAADVAHVLAELSLVPPRRQLHLALQRRQLRQQRLLPPVPAQGFPLQLVARLRVAAAPQR